MEDRLGDLKSIQTVPSTTDIKAEEIMPDFNKKINYTQYCLNKIRDNNQSIRMLKARAVKATLSDQEHEISEELTKLINENTKFCTSVKADLEKMGDDVMIAKDREPDEPETRIKDITYRALKSKFGEVLKEAQSVQLDYKSAVRTKIGRQVKIMDPTLSQNQVEEICDDPDGLGRVMSSKLMGTAHFKLRHAVEDIQDKHRDILKLERSVQTIHQMFVDMALLVQMQGEMLDNIELNVMQAEDYVRKANVQLKAAKKSHQRSKKFKCCAIIILLILIAVIALPIILTKAL